MIRNDVSIEAGLPLTETEVKPAQRIATSLKVFSEAFVEIMRSRFPEMDVKVSYVSPGEVNFGSYDADTICILLPNPENCVEKYIRNPVANKYDYAIRHWAYTHRMSWNGHITLVSGGSAIFVVYSALSMLGSSEFEAWLNEFKTGIPLNLFRVTESLSSLFAGRVVQLVRQLETQEGYLKEAERTYRDELRKVVDQRREIERIKGLGTSEMSKVLEELEQLKTLIPSRYSHFVWEEGLNRMVGYTQPVHLQYQGATYDLGKFTVGVNYVDRYIEIKQVNPRHLRLVRDGLIHHPHISGNSICLGNLEVPVAELLQKVEIFGTFFILSNFLNSYNPNSPYRVIEVWPIIAGGGNVQETQSTEREAQNLRHENIEGDESLEVGPPPEPMATATAEATPTPEGGRNIDLTAGAQRNQAMREFTSDSGWDLIFCGGEGELLETRSYFFRYISRAIDQGWVDRNAFDRIYRNTPYEQQLLELGERVTTWSLDRRRNPNISHSRLRAEIRRIYANALQG